MVYWLVISTPLKSMSSSVGIMTFPTEWKTKIDVPKHKNQFSTIVNMLYYIIFIIYIPYIMYSTNQYSSIIRGWHSPISWGDAPQTDLQASSGSEVGPTEAPDQRERGESWLSWIQFHQETYNVRPPSDVCWFISPSNYSYKYHKP